MAKYMIGNKVVDSDEATRFWDESPKTVDVKKTATYNVTVRRLFLTKKGNYWFENFYVGETEKVLLPNAEWATPEEATAWLVLHNHDVPDDLKQYVDEVCE